MKNKFKKLPVLMMSIIIVVAMMTTGCDDDKKYSVTNQDVYTAFLLQVNDIITDAFGSGTMAPSVQGVKVNGVKGSVTFETSNPIIFSFWNYSSNGKIVISPDNGNLIPDFTGESLTPDVETLEATINEATLAPAAPGTYDFDAFDTTAPMTGTLTIGGAYPGTITANLTLKYIVTVTNMVDVLGGADPILGQAYIDLSGTLTVQSEDQTESEELLFPATGLIPL